MEEKPVENKEELKQEPQPLKLMITLFPDNNFKVEGNAMNDQVVAFGILEQAKLVIIQYNMIKAQQNKIITPKGGIMDFIRKKRF